MGKWIAEFDLEDGDTMPEHMDLKYMGVRLDFHCRPMWIPVSKRLPEDFELVLFSTKTDRVFEGRYFADNTDLQWYAFRDETFTRNNIVTAWMPLPEPYELQESEDKK